MPDRVEIIGLLRGLGPDAGDGRAVWRALGHKGCLRPVYADRPVRPRALGSLIEALDHALPTGPVLAACVQLATSVPILREVGATGIAERTVAGDAVTALAVTDAGAPGSDVTAMTTAVEITDDQVVLRGGKRWITAGTYADHLLVLARHRPGPHFANFTWVLVPAGTAGVRIEAADTPYFAGSGVAHIDFDDVVLPRDALVGSAGRGLATFTRHIATERLAGALWVTALTRRVLRDTREFLLRRAVGGDPLWTNPAVRARFARCVVEHRALAALCAAYDESVPDFGAAMVLKVAAARCADRVVGECASLRGADGFGHGGLAALRAEAGMFGIAGGATDVLLDGIADRSDQWLAEPA